MVYKILVVDDDLETIRLIGVMLQRKGYEVVTASNGYKAMTLARNERPDLIVMDPFLPDLDGLEVVRAIRRELNLNKIPVLIFTSSTEKEFKTAVLIAGADDFLVKPVHPDEFLNHIQTLLSQAHSEIHAQATQPGHMIGVVGCKGGMGVSTVALNLAISLAARSERDVIALELRPGQGTWAAELGFGDLDNLEKLLSMPNPEINPATLTDFLIDTPYEVRFLPASGKLSSIDFQEYAGKLKTILSTVRKMDSIVILDIGTPFIPTFDHITSLCDETIVIANESPQALNRTRVLIDAIYMHNSGKPVNLVLYNRFEAVSNLSSEETPSLAKFPVTAILTPSAEQQSVAAQNHLPLIKAQPGGNLAQQYLELTEIIQARFTQ